MPAADFLSAGDVLSETFVCRAEILEETASTNDDAWAAARRGAGELPLLIAARRQTAGRGQGGRRWHSSAGALTCSLLLDAAAHRLEISSWPLVPLAAGLSLCQAARLLCPLEAPRLKWPNDVLVRGRKLAGVLVEGDAARRRIIVGIGLNVNNSFGNATADFARNAISLAEAGGPLDLTRILVAVLQRLEANLRLSAEQPSELMARCRALCSLNGRLVTIESGGRTITGLCRGLGQSGELLIDTPDGTAAFRTGSVSRASPADFSGPCGYDGE